jgi:hypothetical protein
MAWKSSRRSGRDESGEIPTPTAAELRRLPVDERIRVLREVRMAQKAARDVRDAERGIPEPYEPEDENSYEAGRTLDRLLSSDTAAAEEWLSENRAIINDADAQALGIADVLEAYDGEVDNSEPSIWDKVSGTVGDALGLIARPGQMGAEAWQAFKDDIPGPEPVKRVLGVGGGLGAIMPDARTDEQREEDGGWGDVWQAFLGRPRYNPVTEQQDEYIPLFTMFGHERPDDGPGKYAYDVGQFAGESVLDPLAYLSGGTKTAARPALEAGATMLAREAGEGGLRSASPLLARRLGDDLSEQAILRGLQDTGIRGLTREGRTALRSTIAGTAGERAAARQLRAAGRYDRGGLRVGIGGTRWGLGRSIVPRSGLRRAGQATRLIDKVRYTPAAEIEARLLSDARGRAEGLLDSATLARMSDDEIDDLLQEATELSYRAEDRAARSGALDAKRRSITDLSPQLRASMESGDYDRAVDILGELSDAGVKGAESLFRPLWKGVRTGTQDEDVLRRLTRFSYDLDERAVRAESGLMNRGPSETSLQGFDVDRLVRALQDRNPDELAEALGNQAAQAVPGSRPLAQSAEAWRASVGDADTLAASSRALTDALDAGDLDAVRALAPSAGHAGLNTSRVVSPGLFSSIRKSTPFSKIEAGFSPRAGVRSSSTLTEGTDRALYDVQSQAQAFGHQESERRVRHFLSVTKGLPNEERAALRNVFDVGHTADETVLSNAGKAALRALREEDDRIRRSLLDDVGIPESELRDLGDYFPHMFTDKGRRVLERAHKDGVLDPALLDEIGIAFTDRGRISKATELLGATGQRGHLKRRNANLSVDEINSRLSQAIGREVDFYETDPFVAFARRGHAADRAAATAKLFDDAAEKIKAPDGGALVVRVPKNSDDATFAAARETADGRGLQRIETADGSQVYAHPDLAPDLENAIRILDDDEAMQAFGRFMESWGRLWRGYATVPLATGPGFFSRNALGNIFNSYIKGVKNPAAYVRALDIQKDVTRAIRANPDLDIPSAMRAIGVSDDKIRYVDGALRNGILRDGFASADLPTGTVERLRGSGSVKRGINPLNQDNWLIRSGGAVNAVVEDNARLAHYITKMDEFGDEAIAAASVKDALFDYRDLTKFERGIKRNLIPFYTFMRKNVPFQVRAVAENPGRLARAERFGRMIVGSEEQTGDENWAGTSPTTIGGRTVPGWATERGNLLTPGFFGTDGPAFGRLDTPLAGAAESVAPLILAAQVASGDADGAQLARSLVNMPGGGPVELARVLTEEATGASAFTGGSIRDRETGERKKNIWLRLSQTVIPTVDRVYGTYNIDDRATEDARTRIWESITGLQVRQINEEDSDTERRRRIEALSDALEAYNKANPDNEAPTVEELQDIGLVPNPEQDARDAAAAREEGRGGRRRRSGW